MEQRELVVTILSANNLKNVKLSGRKMSPYAVAHIYPNVKVSTPVAEQGGESPSWNCILRLSCDERLFQAANAHITVELYNHGKFSNKLIGTALVPLSAGKDSIEGKAKEYPVRSVVLRFCFALLSFFFVLILRCMCGPIVLWAPPPPHTVRTVGPDRIENCLSHLVRNCDE